jgi:hypothetical protein
MPQLIECCINRGCTVPNLLEQVLYLLGVHLSVTAGSRSVTGIS